MRTGLLLCAVLSAAVVVHAQEPAKKKKDDRPVIVITGCVDGSWLEVRRTDAIGWYATRYRLRGSKQLMSEIRKKFERHLLEITGAVLDTGTTTHRGKTIEIGKTRVHTGAKEVPRQPTGTGEPELEVISFRDLKDKCG
jgi:hypothetical protein